MHQPEVVKKLKLRIAELEAEVQKLRAELEQARDMIGLKNNTIILLTSSIPKRPCTHEYGTRGGICEKCGAEL